MNSGTLNTIITAIIAVLIFAFGGFVLFITRHADGSLDTAAVALVGPLTGAVGAFFFHLQSSGQGAAISTAGATAGVAAAVGQPTTVSTPGGTVTTGRLI